MSKKKKIVMIFSPLFIIITFFAIKFWAQQYVVEGYSIFTEDFDEIGFKDEEKSSVENWGNGYITLNWAGYISKIPGAANFPTWINTVAFADFDGDGLKDLIGSSDAYSKRICFIKNEGGGNFSELSPYIYDEKWDMRLNSLVAGDFNGDNVPDFMYILSTKDAGSPVGPLDEVWFFEHQGYESIPTSGVPQFNRYDYTGELSEDLEGVGWGATNKSIDFDEDGDIDILFANGYGKVLLMRNSGNDVPLSDISNKFSVEVLIDAKEGEDDSRWNERGITSIGTGDFDGDEYVDIIVGSANWRGLKLYKNDGSGKFTLHEVLGDMTGQNLHDDLYDGACTAVAVADYDKDGDLDFVVGTDNWNPQEAYPPEYYSGGRRYNSGCGFYYDSGTEMGAKAFYFKNDGSGNFESELIYDGPALIDEGICAAWDFDFGLPLDYDGDGDIDIMIADGNHSKFYYYFENLVSDRFNLNGEAVSTNVTKDAFPPDGLDPDEYAITKVQFTKLNQSVIGSSNGLKIKYYVSNDAGRDWEFYAEFEDNDIHTYANLPVHTFNTFGSDLRWKAVMSAPNDYPECHEFYNTSDDTPRIDKIELKYFYVEKQEYSRTSLVYTTIPDKKLIIGASFIFPSWNGHLRAYDVTGSTFQPNSYSNLTTVSSSDLSSPSGRVIEDSGVRILWDAGEELASRPASDRMIYTAYATEGSSLARIDFTPENVAILGPILRDVNNDNEGLINFVRGEERGEERDWKLGDINHSNPIVVGPPEGTLDLMGDGYEEFKNDYKDRAKVLYVGANDGMLHCFDVENGKELWGFIPKNLLPMLKNMWRVDLEGKRYFYRNWYVDGSPVTADVKIGGIWKTVLIYGQGPGRGQVHDTIPNYNYYFALDITNPYEPQPLWEFTHKRMGETWSTPAIGKIVKNGNDKWAAFMGSGYDNYSEHKTGNRFYAVNVANGNQLWRFNAGEVNTNGNNGWNIPNSIPGSPSIIDTDQDGYADSVYFGDMDGRLWKVNVGVELKKQGEKWTWDKEIETIYEDSNNYPIITKPDVWINPASTGSIPRIFFGTGGDDDAPNDVFYSFIALLDANTPEVEWYMGDPDILNLPPEKNKADMENDWEAGDKVWANPQVANFIVYFSTFKGSIESVDPSENAGIGKLYARYVLSVAGSPVGGTAVKGDSGALESLNLASKSRSAVTLGESSKVQGIRKREVYIQEYDSTIQKLEQPVGSFLKVKSWREIYKIIR